MTTTTTRKQTPAQARKAALESDYTPLYAVAGLTDAIVAEVRTVVTLTREQAAKRFADLQSKRAEARKQVAGLPQQVRALPETTKIRIAEVQKQAQGLITEANTAYAELAGRGKRVVDETVVVARTLSGKAEQRADSVIADVADAVDPAFEAVQEGVTRARQTVTGRTATETVTPRSAAKATASRAATAEAEEAKTEARRAAAKRGAATRAAKKAAS